MNRFILRLFAELETSRVRHCHWKSNNNLHPALCGVDDLDLLVALPDFGRFMSLVHGLGFVLARDPGPESTPFVFHLFGMDSATGLLVHLHVYFRLITAGSMVKNHWIPLEEMLLSESVRHEGVITPCREAELCVFIIRKLLEQPRLVEHFLFWRDRANIAKEYQWLTQGLDREKLAGLLRRWAPAIDVDFFRECSEIFEKRVSIRRRAKLGRKMEALFPATLSAPWRASLRRTRLFVTAYLKGKLYRRRARKSRSLLPGGRLIAFVGPEASGKSTLSRASAEWMATAIATEHLHLGKPPKSLLTRPAWVLIHFYSWVKRGVRSTASKPPGSPSSSSRELGEPHPVSAILDAWDRRSLLQRVTRDMMKGRTIVTDRFPTSNPDSVDGPRVNPVQGRWRWLADAERRIYSGIPEPDLVFKVEAPLETTLVRNSQRAKPEPEAYVRARYEKARRISFPRARTVSINTTLPFEESFLQIKQEIWGLSGSPPP